MAEREIRVRRVRIIVSEPDPDATDSSSDEEAAGRAKPRRRLIREVFVNSSRPTGKSGESTDPNENSISDPDPGTGERVRGVRKRKWGRWCAEIRDPVVKRRVWLGTFNSQQEASQAYNARKQELEKVAKAKQGINRDCCSKGKGQTKSNEGSSEKSCAKLHENLTPKEKGILGVHEVEESKVEEFKESKESEIGDVQSSDSCSSNADDKTGEEKYDDGQWVKLPDGTEVNFSLKYGIPIIDNYGFLVGDLRKLDDDLWIRSPEDDV